MSQEVKNPHARSTAVGLKCCIPMRELIEGGHGEILRRPIDSGQTVIALILNPYAGPRFCVTASLVRHKSRKFKSRFQSQLHWNYVCQRRGFLDQEPTGLTEDGSGIE